MINLSVPQAAEPTLKPCITVIGVGGAGGNAVNNMINDNLQGVDFVVANTDAQALSMARTNRRIQLGADTTQGLGAGARPEIGRAAAEETYETIAKEIQGANMVFITAGMGGGTGTGAAPVIARVAREMGILTVGVVTKPFQFEGAHRMRLAESGIEELSQYVDTLIIIPNQNLFRVANEKTTFADAFKMADDVLHQGVRSITDLMIMPGLINLDFADVRTVMSDMGRAMMGTGTATGDRRALDAAEAAISNPLLEDTCMKGAKGVLINITGGMDVTLFEVDEAANRIRDEVEGEAHIIFGSCFDPEMEGKMRVSVVATGIQTQAVQMPVPRPQQAAPQQAQAPRHAPIPAPRGVGITAPPAMPQAAAPQPSYQQPVYQQQPAAPAPQQPMKQAPAAYAAPQQAPQMQAPMGSDLDALYAPPSQRAPEAPAWQQPAPQQAPQMVRAGESFIPAPAATRDVSGGQPMSQNPMGQNPMGQNPMGMPAPRAFASEPRTMAQPSHPTLGAQLGGPQMGNSQAAVQHAPQHQPMVADRPAPAAAPAARQGAGNLFSRLTRLASRDHADDGMQQAAPVDHRQQAYHAEPVAPPQPERQPMSRKDEDELEIPAFLRRQAN
ncbi:cell division protein FtsZ [Novispirillum itersonii]|uniref:Cell division protein FtsZ n=1 Tax=Novispirillum itersonii TaxID=189 RepID=A0A7W9ZDL6_NOVIT|nr:cell division protein FtsZ [Novispirillum itersonii]MBB6209511.1 cell division protein FtsZ [Novispirillum itersonii]